MWYGVDPMAEKNYAYTPYVYTGNNPIRFIDLDGNDWYEDENCKRRFDEKLTKANQSEFLKPGQRYLGETHSEKTSDGKGTNNYRRDGIALFGSQADGVKYMSENSSQKEQFGFVKGNTILVTPDKVNKDDESFPERAGYKFSDGIFFDPVSGKEKSFDATVHTYPIGGDQIPSGIMGLQGDVQRQGRSHPSKPGFVLGMEKGVITGYGQNNAWPARNIQTNKKINVKDIIQGKERLPYYGKKLSF